MSPPFQPGLQRGVQEVVGGQLVRAGEDHLLLVVVEMVEDQDHLLLERGVAADALEVVHQEEVEGVEVFPGLVGVPGETALVHGLHVLHRAQEDARPGLALADLVAHGFQQVGLAAPALAADDEGIEHDLPLLGHLPGRGHREVVLLVHQEVLEGELGPEGEIDAGLLGTGRGRGRAPAVRAVGVAHGEPVAQKAVQLLLETVLEPGREPLGEEGVGKDHADPLLPVLELYVQGVEPASELLLRAGGEEELAQFLFQHEDSSAGRGRVK